MGPGSILCTYASKPNLLLLLPFHARAVKQFLSLLPCLVDGNNAGFDKSSDNLLQRLIEMTHEHILCSSKLHGFTASS